MGAFESNPFMHTGFTGSLYSIIPETAKVTEPQSEAEPPRREWQMTLILKSSMVSAHARADSYLRDFDPVCSATASNMSLPGLQSWPEPHHWETCHESCPVCENTGAAAVINDTYHTQYHCKGTLVGDAGDASATAQIDRSVQQRNRRHHTGTYA
ncbi:predicted protein [Plenodomus lingam JN3]|uniref:Predicted protein n=1 Tax=Leptosphaeria maculans (strain JN3 / isolate v23.1.3 / race Av1-4-5-6-7-8) TaxID=985895 RepID=E4ZH72_LEPMJ|nr:predicted protein [Plenodomus lingam JN3]CBX90642.1 predicted protein [Plenodomus lingam JN3]